MICSGESVCVREVMLQVEKRSRKGTGKVLLLCVQVRELRRAEGGRSLEEKGVAPRQIVAPGSLTEPLAACASKIFLDHVHGVRPERLKLCIHLHTLGARFELGKASFETSIDEIG